MQTGRVEDVASPKLLTAGWIPRVIASLTFSSSTCHLDLAMVPTSLPSWPPSLTSDQHDHLLVLSTTYALSHGFTLLPPSSSTPPTHTFPAPLSLFPTPFPRDLFNLAKEIQPLYNALYARIALDWEFLDKVMGGSVAKVDDFQGELWRGWRRVRDELVQVCRTFTLDSKYQPCWTTWVFGMVGKV